MSWEFGFGLINGIALLLWLALIFLPRTDLIKTAILFAGVGLLCLIYGVLLILLVSGILHGNPLDGASDSGFSSIEEVRAIFLSDGGVVTGWTHYLAFDLFVGLWIARDADNKGFSRLLQAPVLLVTAVAGPLGLLIWLFIREPAARRAAKQAKKAGAA